MPDLAAVGEVVDPVTVLQFHLNAMALAGEVAESRRRTGGMFEIGAGRSMPWWYLRVSFQVEVLELGVAISHVMFDLI
jgi:hypothetical protein